jgi:hypothetical protein
VNILLLTAHSIAAYDDVRMFHDLGYRVFNLDGYIDPAHPHDDKRPALPQVPSQPELQAAVDALGTENNLEAAKRRIPDRVLDWADVIICHHYLDRWVVPQWDRIKGKRVIWRTCGQSDPRLEALMAPLHAQGLQIVRYSPREQPAFERAGAFAGQDALIRFGKYPADWYGWMGTDAVVGNVTQDMVGRGEACGLSFYQEATKGLPAKPAGPMSERLPGGIGALTYDEMRDYLRRVRVYLYTGTVPASYTLGLIEAMMTGVPVLSINKYPDDWIGDLFEGPDILRSGGGYTDPEDARTELAYLLAGRDMDGARRHGAALRKLAIETFGIETIGAQWADFLGSASKAIAA